MIFFKVKIKKNFNLMFDTHRKIFIYIYNQNQHGLYTSCYIRKQWKCEYLTQSEYRK